MGGAVVVGGAAVVGGAEVVGGAAVVTSTPFGQVIIIVNSKHISTSLRIS